jgi:hypothetical protein
VTCPVCGRPAVGEVGEVTAIAHPERLPKYPGTPHCGIQHRSEKWGRALQLNQRAARNVASRVGQHVRDLVAAGGLY